MGSDQREELIGRIHRTNGRQRSGAIVDDRRKRSVISGGRRLGVLSRGGPEPRGRIGDGPQDAGRTETAQPGRANQ
jgi:hypothetical protein